MRLLQQLRIRIQMLFQRGRAAGQLDSELQFHIDQQIAENAAAGMAPSEARAAALRSFGNPMLLREQTRATWSWSLLESLGRDFRFGARTLLRTPGFAAVAILVMALGIGANVTLFTVVHSILMQPLPFPQQDRLFAVYNLYKSSELTTGASTPIDAGSFYDWQQAVGSSAELALYSPDRDYSVSSESGRLPEKVDATVVAANVFPVLGVHPFIGRGFSAEDDRPNAEATVILAHSFWSRRYGADPAILGRKIYLDAKPFLVIGVMPDWFTWPEATNQIFVANGHESPPSLLKTYEDHEFQCVGRLAQGANLPAVLNELQVVQSHIKAAHPGPAIRDKVGGRTLLDDTVVDARTPLYALLSATVCLLLIACLNVASLLVARSAARQRDLAIRSALGGSRARLIREHLTESFILSFAGAAGGLALAQLAIVWVRHSELGLARAESVQIDGTVLLFVLLLAGACGLFAGLLPFLGLDTRNLMASLQHASRSLGGSGKRVRLRKTLLVVEMSLTVVLLVGSGLLLKSYQRLRSVDLGVPIDNTLTMQFSLPEARYKELSQQRAFFEQTLLRVQALPGVASAALISRAPGQGWGGDHLMSVVEHPPLPPGKGLDVLTRAADPGYFAAMHIPLLRGRIYTADEYERRAASERPMVISKAAADLCFPGEDPIGKHFLGGLTGERFEVIGVVGDTRWSVALPPRATSYVPLFGSGYTSVTLMVRSAQRVDTLALPTQKIIGQLDPDLPVSDVQTLRETIGKSTLHEQFDSVLVVGFALISLILAAVGLHGVLSYLVTQQTSEIGIRIALGAQRGSVLRRVLLSGLRPAALGLLLGLGLTAGLVRFIQSMLYQTQPFDAGVFVSVSVILLAVAAFACVIPAWNASRLNPVQALRME